MSDDAQEVGRSKYVRSFEHPCDDFVIVDGEGNEYHPHAGESVRFRSAMLWALMRIRADLPGLEYAQRVVGALRHQILWWDWTDDAGKLWPSPDTDPEGFAEVLWYISDDERNYLRMHCWDSARLGEA